MAIGDTVQAGLMRVDFSPIQRAGEAQARANQAFGQTIGNVLDKFYEKKREKAQQESIADTLVSTFGVNRDEANHLSKNKEFIPTFFEQQKAEKDYQHKLDQFNQLKSVQDLQKENIRQGMARLKTADELAEEKERQTEAFYDRLNDTIATDELTPEAQQRIENFSSAVNPTDPRRLAQVNDPQAFMERVQNDPSSYVQKPVYELQGRDFLSQFEDPGMFQKALAFQQANQPKQMTPEEIAQYEGTLLDNRKKKLDLDQKENPKPTANLAYTEATLNAISDAGNILERSGLPSTGFWGDKLQNIGGTNAADLRASVETIVSSIGFDKLQDMRDRSPTGGALGQVSERELAQLNASLGSLKQSQSKEQFQKNLMRVKDHYQKYYKATMAQVKAYEQGIKFETKEEAMSWMDKNFPMGGKPAPDNQTNVTTPGGFSIRKN